MAVNPYPVERETLNTPQAGRPTRSVMQGLQAKQAIVNQVIEGRLPLLEAAARFQAAQRSSPERSALTDTEAICRALIGWVHLALSDRPEQADRISDRLERELQSALERFGGKLSLPPVR